MHILKNWILSFGIKKLAIISTVAVVGVTGTTVAITSVKKSENAVVEEEKIVINSQSDEDKEKEVEKVEEVTEDVVNQEVVTETTPEEAETETIKEHTTTNATNVDHSSSGSTTTSNTTSIESSTQKEESGVPQNTVIEESTAEAEIQTIFLNQIVTYNGYQGYFTLDSNVFNVDLVKYGLANDNSSTFLYPSEYFDIDNNTIVWFACHGSVLPVDFMGYINNVGRGVVKVKTQ